MGLRLVEDEPRADVLPSPPGIDVAATFTEVMVTELHAAAMRSPGERRIAYYLGAELRGPILASAAEVEVRDNDQRGQVVERVVVVPRRFDGIRHDVQEQVAVPGYPPIAIELYHATAAGGVELTCVGTVVANRLGELAALDLDRPPWTNPALAGTIEFAPHVQRALDQHMEQRPPRPSAGSSWNCAARCAACAIGCRGSAWPRRYRDEVVQAGDADPDPLGAPIQPSPLAAGAAADAAPDAVDDPSSIDELAPTLLPPGPVSHVVLAPDPIGLWPGVSRRVKATAFDIHGQQIAADLTWSASSLQIAIEGSGPALVIRLPELLDADSLAVTVVAAANGGTASATADIVVADSTRAGGAGLGIPEPVLVEEPGLAWRSRMTDAGWHVNIAHAALA